MLLIVISGVHILAVYLSNMAGVLEDAGTAYPSLGGVRVANLFTLLCCPITCLFVPSSVL